MQVDGKGEEIIAQTLFIEIACAVKDTSRIQEVDPGAGSEPSPAYGQGKADRLFPMIYDELRRIARQQLRRERRGHTLSTTALVHEAYLRLANQTHLSSTDRAHFYAIAARAMRRILRRLRAQASCTKARGEAGAAPAR